MPPSPRHAAAIADSTRSGEGSPGSRYWTQYTDYELRARLLPDEKRLDGRARIVYHNRSPRDLFSLHLELSLNLHAPGVVRNESVPPAAPMQLQRIAVDGEVIRAEVDAGPRYVVDGTRLIISPPRPIRAGEEVVLEIDWSTEIPRFGAAGRMGHDNDELFFLAYWYPTMSVFDDVDGWYPDPFRGDAEFYHGFGDYDVYVEAPADWVLHGTGTLVNEREVLASDVLGRLDEARSSDQPVRIIDEDDFGSATAADGDTHLTWHFSADRVSDFAFSATRHSLWDAARSPVGDMNGDGTVDYTLVSAVYRTNAPLWKQVVGYGQHAIRFLSDYTGIAYPWPHVTAVEGTPIETGGMEYPMMTLIGNYNARGDSALYAVVAHELAHQWVPMIVSPNERRYGWMDEGLTTFAENAAKHDRSPEAMHRLNELHQYVLTSRRGLESEIMTWSDYHYPPIANVVAVYFKPATVFEALKGMLGEEVFDEAYQTFLREWSYGHPYPEDFFATFERVSGRDLDWFWRAWFYETWQLDQAIADVHQQDGSLVVTVESLGDVPMPVHLTIELQDGSIVRRNYDADDLWLDGSLAATLRVPVDGTVVRVEIDPEMYFPDVERSNNVWWSGSTTTSN